MTTGIYAAASVEMEGFTVDEETKLMCTKLLKGEITFDGYLTFTLKRAGVSA